ncbi:MAG: porphobilinogen synthase [Paracoccus sp. (in: a-proteobacteria)]|nr:porphobilinogen synthase [Paracoccus sp. (in: a-proteobacteria)]
MPNPILAPFPATRLRRLRQSPAMRAMLSETTLSPAHLIWPVFVTEIEGADVEIAAMPGVRRYTPESVKTAAEAAARAGIGAICVFPHSDQASKTDDCARAWDADNIGNRAIRAIKDAVPEMLVMTDIALDPYNASGQDGLVRDGVVLNDETIEALVRMALVQAECGADILGPSDMMDGRIGALRSAMESAGHKDIAIMSYAAKFASAFYGPFRDAVGAAERLTGDKKTYQINPGNRAEALRCVARDLSEGADMVMVKPGMPYLDICRDVRERFDAPTFAYQVSGEYAMLAGAIQRGWLGRETVLESLIAFRRAGCDGILTYFAPEIAEMLA